MISLDQAPFSNDFVDELPGETAPDASPRQVPGACYSRIAPTPVPDPHLLAWSDALGAELGLARPPERGPAVAILGGNLLTASMKPFAARYGGHQFGNWAGQLGDGRAIALGQVPAPDGSRPEIQLKGAGPTPYSRRADGRAVLRSSVREFLCSEAMHHLGVPTTRALSLVATGENVVRDMFYSGNPQFEPGAVVARVAPTFVRFGNFQLFAATGEMDNLKTLADFVIRHHFPHLGPPGPAAYVAWFEEIVARTARLVAHWMTVGFVHGVLNTDNMSILGLTIDYGPYGWLEPYDPDWTPNTTDFGSRRYAFGQQPAVGHWNLAALAQALALLLPDAPKSLRPALQAYPARLAAATHALLLPKLGLTPRPDADAVGVAEASAATEAPTEAADRALTQGLPAALAEAGVDMTVFFRQLSHLAPALLNTPADDAARTPHFDQLLALAGYPDATGALPPAPLLRAWLGQYVERLTLETAAPAAIQATMLAANPKFVLRNYLAAQAIEAAEEGDLGPLNDLFGVLQTPFDEHPAHEHLAAKRPDWAAAKPGSATLSCSS